MKTVKIIARRSDSPTSFSDSVSLECGNVTCVASRSSFDFIGSQFNMTQTDMLTVLRNFKGKHSIKLDNLKDIISPELFDTLQGAKS